MQYYIIDDLRLPPKRTFHKGWTMERFPSLQEALARYRALPSRQAKSLGMTDGIHVLELARHVLIYPAEAAGRTFRRPAGTAAAMGGDTRGDGCGRRLYLRFEPSLSALRERGDTRPIQR